MKLVLHYISPQSLCGKSEPNQVNDPWYIPAVLTGKPVCCSNCPSESAQVFHRYMTEHPELRKGRRRFFVSSKDNNVGKELSAASISWWICTTIVDSHASLHSSENSPRKVKAQEVRAVTTYR